MSSVNEQEQQRRCAGCPRGGLDETEDDGKPGGPTER